MKKTILTSVIGIVVLAIGAYIFYPQIFSGNQERKILYWTDPMIAGDRSDHPGKSPMGMERIPMYENEQITNSSASTPSLEKSYYTCPMHPSVHKDKPGACPVCGMTLVKKVESSSAVNPEGVHNTNELRISPSKQVLANVATTTAQRVGLTKEIIAAGRIDYAEPNFRHISTRFPGRLEKLYLTFTGQKVKKGDPVADLYSPEAISAQQEYLLAKDSYDQVKESPDLISGGAVALLQQSKKKLLLWGFTEEQIVQLENTKTVRTIVTIHSPISGTVLKKNVDPQHYVTEGEDIYDVADLSTVWMYADVYENEIQSVQIAQKVEATSDAFPGETFKGTITFISPTIDAETRTVRVRAEFSNPREKLKPEMYMKTKIKIPLHPSLAVPVTAVLTAGGRNIVWVQKRENVYEPHTVTLGIQAGDYYQILDGIHEGDTVVTFGGYLLDSESQLQAPTTSEHDNHN